MPQSYIEELIDGMAIWIRKVPDVENVVLRSLNTVDKNGTVGISVDDWTPMDWEMAGAGSQEPTTQRYSLSIQHIVKYGTQEEGKRIHREVAKAIRLMLYRDPDFQLSLRTLLVVEDSRKERTLRLNVTDQRYASNNAGSAGFLFMSVTGLTVETETVTTP